MLKTIAIIITLGALAVGAQVLMPRSRYLAEAAAVETSGTEPHFEFRFPKAQGKVLIDRVILRVVDAPLSGYCGFGAPGSNTVETDQTRVPLAGVPQRRNSVEWHSDTIDSAQAIVVEAGSAYTVRVAGRCGAASAKAVVTGTWIR